MAYRPIMSLTQTMARGESAARKYGRLDSTPTPFASLMGRERYRLTIYPPGTSRSEARWLSFVALGSTWSGAVVGMMAFIVVLVAVSLGAGITAAVFLYGVWAIAFALTARLRRQTVVLRATAGPHNRVDERTQAFLATLEAFDRLDGRDELDPVAYELEWSRIYNTAKGRSA